MSENLQIDLISTRRANGATEIKSAIEPFIIHISDEKLASIRAKVEAYDWALLPDAGGWSAGVGIRDIKRLVDYWVTTYDWRVSEKRLNQLPHFTTDIDGECIHFIHVLGKGHRPPILLLHGWPGSFIEFEQLIDPLVSDDHSVIVPSLPGFAFSKPITAPIGTKRAAELMHKLMAKLHPNQRFFVQGGDWGHGIAGWMAHLKPDMLLGIHINMVDLMTKDIEPTTDEEKAFVAKRAAILAEETGYSHLQETRPQTLGVAIADSPVGAAAWILEKFGNWSDLPKTLDGSPDIWSKYSEELLLTNIMLYMATSSMVSSTWIYHGKHIEDSQTFPSGTRIRVPTGVAAFRDPVFRPPPRSFAQKTYNVVHWTEMPAGGHFAALEQPDLLLADIRAFIAKITEVSK